jgi:hypothetical protein
VKQTQSSIILIILVIVAGLLAAACSPGEQTASAAAPVYTIEVSDTGLITPEQIPTGIITISFKNIGKIAHNPFIVRLNEGVTAEQFMTALAQENPMAAVSLVHLLGGLSVAPGAEQQIIYDLRPGTHVAMDFGEQGPITTLFQTGGEKSESAAPEAQVKVQLNDFTFIMPDQIKAGPQTWQIENAGNQWHEMGIIKLNEGVDVHAVITALNQAEEPAGPPPFEEVAFWAPISEGEQAWTTLDLKPGVYTVI